MLLANRQPTQLYQIIQGDYLMRLTAQISRNFRDVATGVPKVLLRSIVNENNEEFRDHAWVPMNKQLQQFFAKSLPKNGKRVIQFEADEKLYEYRGEVFKKTLENVTNIKVLGRA